MTSCLFTWSTKSSQNGIFSKRQELVPMGAIFFLNEMELKQTGPQTTQIQN